MRVKLFYTCTCFLCNSRFKSSLELMLCVIDISTLNKTYLIFDLSGDSFSSCFKSSYKFFLYLPTFCLCIYHELGQQLDIFPSNSRVTKQIIVFKCKIKPEHIPVPILDWYYFTVTLKINYSSYKDLNTQIIYTPKKTDETTVLT